MTSKTPFFSIVFSFALTLGCFGASVFISEIHYDNVSADSGEAIEIYVQTGTTLADVRVSLYNGGNQQTYLSAETANDMVVGGSITLDGVDYGVYTWTRSGIQNGSPDGISVDISGVLYEFISYEGSFTAIGGPADGITSTDIGVSQSGTTLVGSSIELTDSGWISDNDGTNSFGLANPGLTTNPIPEPSSALLGGVALLGLLRRRRSSAVISLKASAIA